MADALGIFQVAIVVALSLTGRDLFLTGGSAQKPKKDSAKVMSGGAAAGGGPTGATAPVGPNIKFLICYG